MSWNTYKCPECGKTNCNSTARVSPPPRSSSRVHFFNHHFRTLKCIFCGANLAADPTAPRASLAVLDTGFENIQPPMHLFVGQSFQCCCPNCGAPTHRTLMPEDVEDIPWVGGEAKIPIFCMSCEHEWFHDISTTEPVVEILSVEEV